MSQADSTHKRPTIARAASLIAVGNIASRLLGLLREVVIAYYFGATELVSAFRIAQQVPTMLYDLLVGGMVSSALVPLFSEQADRSSTDLWRIASLILSWVTVLMSLTILLVQLTAPQVTYLLASGFDDDLLAITTDLLRLTTPAILFLGLSGVVTGLLQALNRFALPAFTAATFNATIILTATVGVALFDWGIETLAFGLLLGALMQLVLQLPALRDARLRPRFDLRDPIFKRLARLGLPILLGLVISQIAIAIDRNLASRTGEQSIAWMQNATTIIQFPLGLIVTAISLAILPTLSRAATSRPIADTSIKANGDAGGLPPDFMATLAMGLRFVLLLIIPATVGLFILADPIVALLFERGAFRPFDTEQTALALRYYLIGLTFAAIDQPLIFAYYARQNTLTPALVGLLGVGFYLVAALTPTLLFNRPILMTDLVLANSLQLMGHALVMVVLVHRMESLAGRGLVEITLKAVGAALLMGGGVVGLMSVLQPWLSADDFLTRLTLIGLATTCGGGIYALSLTLLRVTEVGLLLQLLRQRFG